MSGLWYTTIVIKTNDCCVAYRWDISWPTVKNRFKFHGRIDLHISNQVHRKVFMEMINQMIGLFLGYLMYICYSVVKNYGLSIILFTLATKILLFPVSIWVQKNSVKIVKLQPEINRIKTDYFGDKDRIAEKQAELYKREKYNAFISIVPVVIQLILLVGLVDVIREPRPEIPQNAMKLFGMDLQQIPWERGGIALLLPVVAALAAWLLCFVQNRINPLQAEQNKWNQLGMTLLSVGISLFLGAFVPLGVGLYWIFSNLFTILQQLLLNRIIDPHKYIDYEELEKSKAALSELEGLGKKKRIFFRDPNTAREKADYKRFFSIANKHLVFYSESSGFYKYFQNIIEYLLANSNVVIHYITNDPNDAIFQKAGQRIRAYYIGEKRLITLMMKMDADIVVMTMPDLENYHIKRSYIRNDIEYIYTDHGISSNNLTLREHALANFDTIFCVGPHQKEEYLKEEEVYGIKKRRLIETGYCLLDNMRENYWKKPSLKEEQDKKTILIAPSWQKDNILDVCIDELLHQVVGKEYEVIVRPHPQYVRLHRGRIEALIERWKDSLDEKFRVEMDFSSNETVYTADLLITDWSNIGYEFSFTTDKPTLYINTPMKVMNPNYKKLGITPFDVRVRTQIGAAIDLDSLQTVGKVVENLIDNTDRYHDIIEKIRIASFYNPGVSGEVGGQYILRRLKEKQTARKQGNL